MTYIFSIEGNIGSGKSTLVKELQKSVPNILDKKVVYVQEPVNEWSKIKDKKGETILEKFYADQHKYAFSFQMMAYISRLALLRNIVRENPDAIIITERSVFTDREVFAKMLYDEGKIEDVDYQIYLKWFDEFIEEIPITGLIYVTTTPEKSKQRVDLRARMGESIPLSYLQRCHNYHESWIKNIKKQVCLFNGNVDFKDNLDYLAKDLVTGFIIRHVSPQNNPHMYTMCSC
jgi:deoxyadenosine/deoxycytidine kinase|tara:strand:- start:679 stop:1374 length:696 start_codon:yes stop_codon:yes gene_type:complete